ncbi:hypothetical protein CSE_00020 [Caldisericum exile AZM16c01]|uniref:Uncharacterized protein n=1 Tax=Caldisericum exile (strain DSM 21853 / NBRC 104410 / AZM16c01) TaxID=511051 RepID=A0A7U6GCY7_CALEA|nr:hypothetical protein CSE_00020 [Caldisericum exile AZM16c01]
MGCGKVEKKTKLLTSFYTRKTYKIIAFIKSFHAIHMYYEGYYDSFNIY